MQLAMLQHMRIGGNTGQLTDSGESVMRIGVNTSQLTDSVESVMRIGGNTGQLTDSDKSVMRIGGNTKRCHFSFPVFLKKPVSINIFYNIYSYIAYIILFGFGSSTKSFL